MEKVIDEAISGAEIEVGNLRDEYENILEEIVKISQKEGAAKLSENEKIPLCELEKQRKRVEKYILSIVDEFSDIRSIIMKNKK
jgi:hypothetical protein